MFRPAVVWEDPGVGLAPGLPNPRPYRRTWIPRIVPGGRRWTPRIYAAIAQVQQGVGAASTAANGTVTATLPANSTSGNLLVAVIGEDAVGFTFTAPTNWVQADLSGFNANAQIWYLSGANNSGGQSSFIFNSNSGGRMWAEVSEWSGADSSSPLNVHANGSASAALSVTATVSSAASNCLAVAFFVQSGATGQTFTPGSGWTNLDKQNSGLGVTAGKTGDYKLGQSGTVSELETSTSSAIWDWVIATFKPSPAAVLAILGTGVVNPKRRPRFGPFTAYSAPVQQDVPPVLPWSAPVLDIRKVRRKLAFAPIAQPPVSAFVAAATQRVRTVLQAIRTRDLRRGIASRLRRPVYGTRAQFYPRVRRTLVAVSRSYARLRVARPLRTKVVGRAVALTFVWAVRRVERQAGYAAQRRRKILSRLRKPVGRALALTFVWRVRAYRQAGPSQQRKRKVRSLLRAPVGKALALTFVWPVRLLTNQANRSQARRRIARAKVRRPVGRAVALLKPYRVKVALAGRAVRDRRRSILSRLRRPVGRAVALTRPYRARVVLAGRAVRDRRRALRSRLAKGFGSPVIIIFPKAVRAYLRIAARSQERRRQVRSRLRGPVGRAFALIRPYRVRVFLSGRAVRDRRRALRSRLRTGQKLITLLRPYAVRVFLAGRAVRDRRRALRSRLRSPVGRAVALLKPYAVRVVQLQSARSQGRKRTLRSRLRRPVGRATALLKPYAVRVQLAGRAVRDRRRALRSRLRVGARLVTLLKPYRVRVFLAGRAVRDRRRALRTRLRLPVGRALARIRPYAVRPFGAVARRSYGRLRRWTLRLRRPPLGKVTPVMGKGVVLSAAKTEGLVGSASLALGQVASAELAVGVIASSAAAVGVVGSYALDTNVGAQP